MRRLRIALVVEAMDTGVAQLVYLLASGLDRRGHEVHLLHSMTRSEPTLLRKLRAETAVRCRAFDMNRLLGWSDFAAGLALRRYLKRNGPFDIVHGHSSKGGALARLGAIGLPGARIYTPHAFYTLSPHLSAVPRLAYGTAECLLARLCHAVICSSKLERRHAAALGIAEKRIAVIANAMAPARNSEPARDRFGFSAAVSCIVGFVGRLEYQKAPDVLLEAVARALAQDRRIGLVMLGDGSRQASLMVLAAELGIAGNVAWLGRRPAAGYLASFDLLALPSRYEGFSLMPLEAMHASLPIICTPVGGTAEAVVDGVTGLVVPVDDAAALAAAILALAGDPARRAAMGAAARGRAPLFRPERMVAAIEQVYVAALTGQLPATAVPPEEIDSHAARPAAERAA